MTTPAQDQLTWLGREFRDRNQEAAFRAETWKQNARVGRGTTVLAFGAAAAGDAALLLDGVAGVTWPVYALTRGAAVLALAALLFIFSRPQPPTGRSALYVFAALALMLVWVSPTVLGTETTSAQLSALVGTLLILFVLPKAATASAPGTSVMSRCMAFRPVS